VRTVCVVGRRAALGGAGHAGRQHAVELGDLEVGIADHRIVDLVALRFGDVLLPALVVVDGIDGQADDLAVALVELVLEAAM
jgi:hypothetical protein